MFKETGSVQRFANISFIRFPQAMNGKQENYKLQSEFFSFEVTFENCVTKSHKICGSRCTISFKSSISMDINMFLK